MGPEPWAGRSPPSAAGSIAGTHSDWRHWSTGRRLAAARKRSSAGSSPGKCRGSRQLLSGPSAETAAWRKRGHRARRAGHRRVDERRHRRGRPTAPDQRRQRAARLAARHQRRQHRDCAGLVASDARLSASRRRPLPRRFREAQRDSPLASSVDPTGRTQDRGPRRCHARGALALGLVKYARRPGHPRRRPSPRPSRLRRRAGRVNLSARPKKRSLPGVAQRHRGLPAPISA